jgi:hypothetical protein
MCTHAYLWGDVVRAGGHRCWVHEPLVVRPVLYVIVMTVYRIRAEVWLAECILARQGRPFA